jgi:hypothetical protein
MPSRNQGVSLLEMAIILVVAGLLVGGVLVGRTLIRNAQLQAVATDFETFKQATELFKDKYKALPGDMTNATDIWGSAGVDCGVGATWGTTRTRLTCNGNGDGMIADYSNSVVVVASGTGSDESTRAWQQLSNAAFIKGTFLGNGAAAAAGFWKPGFSIPEGRVSDQNGYIYSYAAPGDSSGAAYYGNYKNIITYGKTTSLTSTKTAAADPGLSAPDAFTIDAKIDDGRPGQGMVRSLTPSSASTPLCANGLKPETAGYLISTGSTANNLTCSLIFITGF